MKFEKGQIYTFKLITGEEIVAKVVEFTDQEIELEHPITAVYTGQGLQLVPSLFTARHDQKIQLNTASWTMVASVRDDVRNSWIQATTGIAPATKQIITG